MVAYLAWFIEPVLLALRIEPVLSALRIEPVLSALRISSAETLVLHTYVHMCEMTNSSKWIWNVLCVHALVHNCVCSCVWGEDVRMYACKCECLAVTRLFPHCPEFLPIPAVMVNIAQNNEHWKKLVKAKEEAEVCMCACVHTCVRACVCVCSTHICTMCHV